MLQRHPVFFSCWGTQILLVNKLCITFIWDSLQVLAHRESVAKKQNKIIKKCNSYDSACLKDWPTSHFLFRFSSFVFPSQQSKVVLLNSDLLDHVVYILFSFLLPVSFTSQRLCCSLVLTRLILSEEMFKGWDVNTRAAVSSGAFAGKHFARGFSCHFFGVLALGNK